MAMKSGFAATAKQNYILQRYASISKISSTPLIIETLPKKTKSILLLLKTILGENFALAFKKKTIRAGKGKSRNRKYKSNAGILLVTSSDEIKRLKGIDVKQVEEIKISDLYPLGRLTLYTKKALEEMEASL